MEKNNYYILFKKSKNQIPLGDVIRVLYLLKGTSYSIVTNKIYFSFFKQFKIKKAYNISSFNTQKKRNIINLVFGEKIDNSLYDINDFLKKNINKKKTYDLFKNLEKLKKLKINKKKNRKKNLLVGINWKVPNNWKIKSLPKKKWNFIYSELKEKNINVSFQKKFSLYEYVKWIKSCDVIVSVVGLGVHIASFFNKNVIMLSGPTDFKEAKNDKNIIKILPNKRCSVHQRNLNVNYQKCSCMKKIDEKKIIKALIKIIYAR